MKLEKQRKEILEYGRKLLEAGLVHDGAGNISVYDRESGLVAITPSAVPYTQRTSVEDIAVVDLEGNLLEGKWKTTVETNMHLAFYHNRDDVNAVIHTHSPNALVFGIIGKEPLPVVVNDTACMFGGPIPVARWAPPGSPELAQYTCEDVGDGYGAIMANHGLITCGPDLKFAFGATAVAEATAEAVIKARSMGVDVVSIPAERHQGLHEMFTQHYGPKTA
ncbi:MAG: class II aldolase/adducin family protein [Anaerolineales bacterium]|nr:class II aldolase/adducin family protein [Anaerolineales bacterium]